MGLLKGTKDKDYGGNTGDEFGGWKWQPYAHA